MASYPYYQAPVRKTNQKPTPAMPRGIGMPPAPRPTTNPQPQESSGSSGEISAKPMMESSVYDCEIGKEEIQIHLNREDLLKGLIYSEILAPPKSKRMGR